jgi:hypothetical protein
MNGFRGSAGPVRFHLENQSGWLYLIHEVTYEPKWVYMHRFVWVPELTLSATPIHDANLIASDTNKQMRYSLPFSLYCEGIEFACGMAWDHCKQSIWVTFGYRDKEAYRVAFDELQIRSMLQPNTIT